MTNAVNTILNAISDTLLGPLAGWPPLVTLVLVSAVAGVLMSIVFRYTSNQQALRRVADRSRAQVLAIKLFKDDPVGIFRSLGQLMKCTGLRLWYSLPPMLVMLVPFVLLLTQLAQRYEYRPLQPGEKMIVEARLAQRAWPRSAEVALQLPSQIEVEARPLRDHQQHTIYWRARVIAAAPATLSLQVGSQQVDMPITLADDGERLLRVTARRPGAEFWERLLHPGQPGFAADDPLQALTVHYPRRATPLLGFDVPWWLTFLLVSMLAAVLVRPLVKVSF